MKKVYTGIESSGKSLALAVELEAVLKRNIRWYKKTGLPRTIMCNMPLAASFVLRARKAGIPIVNWKNLDEIIYQAECDVFIDELLKYFDARRWADLSLDAKHWLTQGAKTGIHLYGSAQDFSQIDKMFRLLVTHCYQVTKIIGSPRPMRTAPKVTRPWGICVIRQVNPASFKGDSVSMETQGIPSVMFIQRHYCEIFDTNAKIAQTELPRLKHVTRYCEHFGLPDSDCQFCKVIHE